MKSATFEQVLVLAARRRSFCKMLSNDKSGALKSVGWKMSTSELKKLNSFLSAPLSVYKNKTGADLLNYISSLISDEISGAYISSDAVAITLPIPVGPIGDPPGGWPKLDPAPGKQPRRK